MKATMAAHARRRFDALCKAAVMRRMPPGFGSSQLLMDNRRLVSNEAAAQAARVYLHRRRSACSYRWQNARVIIKTPFRIPLDDDSR